MMGNICSDTSLVKAIKRLTHMCKCVIVELRLIARERIFFALKDVRGENDSWIKNSRLLRGRL